jgi:phosphomannomutase
MINSAIFRSYDIRGNSTTTLKISDAYKIGYCYAKMNINSNNNLICVGFDGRISSPLLYEHLVKGINDGGAKIISIGIGPTPLLYFSDKKFNPAASIMITGSHNPKDDNGFKMVANGKSFFGEQIQALLKNIQSTDWNIIENKQASIEEADINKNYVDLILQGFNIKNDLKVAWDGGNGAAGNILNLLAKKLPNTNIIINDKIDGNFPSHHPDPTVPENLVQLIDVVKTEKCDFGIAFDGDADRIGVVTSRGTIIWGDQILCFFAKDILEQHPGSTIIADVKASKIIFDQVKLAGGKPIMWKTGHSHIKTKMIETGALLAGEMSGHIFFADKYYGYDDGIYAAIRLLDLLSRSKINIDEMLAQLPAVFNTPEIRINISDDQKFEVISSIKQHLQKNNVRFNDIDGLRVNNENGWWLLRASNTQAAIIARCEALSAIKLEQLKNDLSLLLLDYDLKLESNNH